MKKKIIQFCTVAVILFTSAAVNAQYWTINGNAGINPNTNFVGTTDKKPLVFKTFNIERMRISNTGSVGIGTKIPVGMLNIDGGTNLSLSNAGYMQIGSSNSHNIGFDPANIQSRNNASNSQLNINALGGSTFVGNTINSYYGLVGYGSADGLLGYSPTIIGVYGSTGGNGDSSFGGYFYNNLGIGVFGEDANSDLPCVLGYSPFSDGDAVNGEAYGGGWGVTGYSTQSYGIYGATDNSRSYAGYFQGNIFCQGTYQSSDEKLKQNVHEAAGALNIINQLRPKIYQFRHDGNYKQMNLPEGEHFGLIAQDVEKVLPDLVKESKFDVMKQVEIKVPNPIADSINHKSAVTKTIMKKTGEQINFKALNYTELIPIIIEGIQEQQQTIEDLQQLGKQQQQQIDDLKQQMQNLIGNKITSSGTNGYLIQNSPNPFSLNTVVRAYVPSSAKQSSLQIFNANGNLMRAYTLNIGMNQVNISGGTLISGQYTYSLLIDGKIADSKSMMFTK